MSQFLEVKEKLNQLYSCDLDEVMELVVDHADHYHDGHFTFMSFTTGVKAMFGTVDLDTGNGRNYVSKLVAYPSFYHAACNLLANDSDYQVGA